MDCLLHPPPPNKGFHILIHRQETPPPQTITYMVDLAQVLVPITLSLTYIIVSVTVQDTGWPDSHHWEQTNHRALSIIVRRPVTLSRPAGDDAPSLRYQPSPSSRPSLPTGHPTCFPLRLELMEVKPARKPWQ